MTSASVTPQTKNDSRPGRSPQSRGSETVCCYCRRECGSPQELGTHLLQDHSDSPPAAGRASEPDDRALQYLQDAAGHELLARDEEIALVRSIRAGGPEAADARRTMIERNLRLVVSIARRHQNRGLPFTDVIQEGNLGLMKAVERFDPDRGFRFSTFATWWIEQSIRYALRQSSRTVRIPGNVIDINTKAHRLMREMTGRDGRAPEIADVATAMGMGAKALARSLARGAAKITSLESEDREGRSTRFEVAAPEAEEEAALGSDEIRRALASVSPKERHILSRRFGLDGRDQASIRELGEELGITHERVRQAEMVALKNLRRECLDDDAPEIELDLPMSAPRARRPRAPRAERPPSGISEAPVERKVPQPHQMEAVEAILAEFLTSNRATAVMACGTGKTMIGLWTFTGTKARTVLILVPSLSLMRQTLREWRAHDAADTYVCVCSDATVPGGDEVRYSEEEIGIPVSTNQPEIRTRLRAAEGRTAVLCTYHSAKTLAEGLPKGFEFDLAIFDEAHRTAGARDRSFSVGLMDEQIHVRRRLFLTATPRGILQHGSADLPFSMADERVYGRHVYKLGLAEAIERGIICDYRVVIAVVTRSDVAAVFASPARVTVGRERISAMDAAYYIAFSRAVQECGASKVISFHGSVAKARAFGDSEWLRKDLLPGFKFFHVNGRMTTGERQWHLDRFRQEPASIVTNARCLNEGVDLPAVDMVAFMSPKKSRIDIIQTIGRALRKAPGKSLGYVMLPVIVDQAGNPISDGDEYRDISHVIWSLRSQDEAFEQRIRLGSFRNGAVLYKDPLDFGEHIVLSGLDVLPEKLREGITAKILSPVGSSWDEMFGRLVAFKKQHGHFLVSESYGDPQFANWVFMQRYRYKKGRLAARQVELLDSIGFVWEAHEFQWDDMFKWLSAFKAEHGTCLVTVSHREPELMEWIRSQRSSWRQGKLDPEKERKLDDLGFVWEALEHQWKAAFEHLREWGKAHGTVHVTDQEDKFLSYWIKQQKNRYHAGKLSSDRIERLESIGFDWSRQPSKGSYPRWEQKFEALLEWKRRHGHFDVPSREGALGTFVREMRLQKKQGTIPGDREKKLDRAGFNWADQKRAARVAEWEGLFKSLQSWKEKHGHCDVPRSTPRLGDFVHHMRQRHRDGSLPEDRRRRLEEIGISWVADRSHVWDTAWGKMYDRLAAFRKRTGRTNVRPSDDVKLQRWVAHQRSFRNKGRLSEERIKLLDALGLDWKLREIHVVRETPASRSRRAVGDIVVRKELCNGRIIECRFIKVSESGPPQKRWMAYARWWWEKNRGPVPKGMSVIHKNGQQIDDTPSNLVLGTSGDRIRLAHLNNPEMSKRNMKTVHEGCAKWNREQGKKFRFKNIVKSSWYPALPAYRVVLNVSFRKRKGLFRAFGVDVSRIPLSGLGPEVDRAVEASGVLPISSAQLAAEPYSSWARVDVDLGLANPEAAGPDAAERIRAVMETPFWRHAKAAAALDVHERA